MKKLWLLACIIFTTGIVAAQTLVSGNYTAQDGRYTIVIKHEGNTITLIEPNRSSTYTSNGGNIYYNTEPKYSQYYFRVEGTNKAYSGKPNGQEFLFTYSGPSTESSTATGINNCPVYTKYADLAKSDTEKQAWTFCASAALAKCTYNAKGIAEHLKPLIASLKLILVDPSRCPCKDAITESEWNGDRQESVAVTKSTIQSSHPLGSREYLNDAYREIDKLIKSQEYSTAYEKVAEVEKAEGKTSAKTLYYAISIFDKSLAENLFPDSKSALSAVEFLMKFIKSFLSFTDLDWNSEEVKYIQKLNQQIDARVASYKKDVFFSDKFSQWPPEISGVRIGMEFPNIPSSAWQGLDPEGSEFKMNGKTTVSYSQRYRSMKVKASEGLSFVSVDKATQKITHVEKNLLVGGKGKMDDAIELYQRLSEKMKNHFGVKNVIEKLDESGERYIRLVSNGVCVYSISLSILNYGVGTEIKVSESYMYPF